ncbi:MAG TPA: hypothetical protein VF416_01540 [Marmoricola sp.]
MRAVGRFAVVLAMGAVLAACSGTDHAKNSSGSVAAPNSCDTAIREGPLPEWARYGFTPPDQAVRYVIGENRHIVGVVFGYPLRAPTGADGRNNKILWVSNAAKSGAPPDLVIDAHLNGTSITAKRTITGGPGPSIVDMPKPGCWTFDLTWSGVHDLLAVPYGS